MSSGRLAFPTTLSAVVLGTFVCLGAPSLARAQSSDPAAADAVFRKGREAAEKGDWVTACPKFAESQRLDPAPGTLLNLADCEEHIGKVASAYEHFKTAVETMAPNDDRIPFAKKHIAEVEKKVPHLTLTAAADLPTNARVMRDEVQLGSASFGLPLPVDPGPHAIVVSAPGRADRRVTVTLKNGDTQTITLRAGDADARAQVSAPVVAPPLATHEVAATGTSGQGGNTKRTLGLVLGGVGIAGIATGAITGALVLGKKSIISDPSHCDQVTHACDQTGADAASAGSTLSTVSTVAFIGGGAALAAGVVLVVLSRGSGESSAKSAAREAPEATTLVSPEAYPGGAGLRVMHTF